MCLMDEVSEAYLCKLCMRLHDRFRTRPRTNYSSHAEHALDVQQLSRLVPQVLFDLLKLQLALVRLFCKLQLVLCDLQNALLGVVSLFDPDMRLCMTT